MLDLLAHGSHKTECYLQILIKNTICQNTLLFLLSSSNTISYCFIIYIYFYFHCITSIHNDGTPRNVFPSCLWAQDGFRRAIRTRRELQGLRGFITPLSLLFPLRSLSFRPFTPAHPFPAWVLCVFSALLRCLFHLPSSYLVLETFPASKMAPIVFGPPTETFSLVSCVLSLLLATLGSAELVSWVDYFPSADAQVMCLHCGALIGQSSPWWQI